MGFSIGSFLGKVAGPIIGGLIGGPAGAVIGGGISAGFGGGGVGGVGRVAETPLQVRARRQAAGQAVLSPAAFAAATGVSVGPSAAIAGGGGARTLVGGLTGMVARGVGFAALGVLSIAELLTLSRESTGQVVTRKKIAAAVRVCGIEAAASMFGLSEIEICQIVISRPRRRGRGISAADLRRTRSTLRKVHNIQHDLGRVKAVRRHHR